MDPRSESESSARRSAADERRLLAAFQQCRATSTRAQLVTPREALLHGAFGLKRALEKYARNVHAHVLATGKHVDCGVAILGPYVDGQMRFGDDDHPGDPPG